MKKKSIFIIVIATLLVLAGAGYWYAKKGRTTKESDKIKVGVILPLTGDAATYGVSLKKGLDIAINENAIELIYEDSKGEPKTAVNCMNKLISIDKVSIVIGDMFTNTTMALVPIANKDKILLLSPTASYSEISEKGQTTFRLYPSEKEEGELLFSFSQHNYSDKRGAIVVVNEDAMLKVARIINQNENNQIIEYSKGLFDFKPILNKLDSKIEIVYLIGYIEECAQFIKQSVEMKKNYTYIGLSTLYSPQLFSLIGNINNQIFISAPSMSLDSTDKISTQRFIENYSKIYNGVPDIWAGYGFDAGKIITKVINAASIHKTSYVSEMFNIQDYLGVTGSISINEDRSISKTMSIIKYESGEFTETNN